VSAVRQMAAAMSRRLVIPLRAAAKPGSGIRAVTTIAYDPPVRLGPATNQHKVKLQQKINTPITRTRLALRGTRRHGYYGYLISPEASKDTSELG
jgi:hypothetical protein